MRKSMFGFAIFILLLSTGLSFGKSIIVKGQLTDSVLVPGGNGIDPVLQINPVANCTLKVSAGCTEEPLDTYFAVTDMNGNYSVIVNLKESCTYKRHLLDVTGIYKGDTVMPYWRGFPEDSLFSAVTANLGFANNHLTVSSQIKGYVHNTRIYGNDLMESGDSINAYCKIQGLQDNTDTLRYTADYRYKISLLTSSGNIAYEDKISDGIGLPFIFLKDYWFQETKLTVKIPENLQDSFADFANDRKLKLIINFCGTVITDTFDFQVIDTSLKVVTTNLTKVGNAINQSGQRGSVKLVSQNNQLNVSFAKSGKYSINLYAADGRLVQSISRDKKYNSGKYVFDLSGSNAGSSKLLIVKVQGKEGSSSLLMKKF